jgi:LysM repeat protein
MTRETKIELTILVILALAVGVWVGLTFTGNDQPSEASSPSGAEAGASVTPIETEEPASGDVPSPARPPAPSAAALSAPETPDPAPADPALRESFEAAKTLIRNSELYEARKAMTDLILAAPEGKLREAIKEELDQVNAVLFWNRSKSPDSVWYEVEGGDTLSKIAVKHGRDPYFLTVLQRVNGLSDPNRIRVGQSLKVPKGAFSAHVEKDAFRLILFFNGHYLKEYPVGLGAPTTPTPAVTFTVDTKDVNPDWTARDGNLYPYGHPKNILGTRWIGFAKEDIHEGYGIHGTNDPDSVGRRMSNGCIRMRKDDVEELFCFLKKGETVTIVD